MQTELFSEKDKGIQRAVDHADQVHPGWSDRAFAFLKEFIRTHTGKFMAEDIRMAAIGVLPYPPSERAWGAVLLRAAKSGLISKRGYGQVKNRKAHNANASVWTRTQTQ